MDDERLDTLASVPLFSGRSRKDLAYFASRVDEVRVTAGTTLTRQGRANDTFYLLLEGEVGVTVDQRPVETLRGGDVFGEISMLERVPATATAVTLTPSRMLVMSHRQFHDAIFGDPGLRAQVTGNAWPRESARLPQARSTGIGRPTFFGSWSTSVRRWAGRLLTQTPGLM